MMPYLNANIYSLFNPSHCYGKAGNEVEIISDNDTVMIVRHKGLKCGFPISKEHLSYEKTEAVSDDYRANNKSKSISKSSKVKKVADSQSSQQLNFNNE
jgi:hypothetical protein